MQSVQAQGGRIEFPLPDEDYLDWLQGKGKGTPPQQGCIPNRFKAARAIVPASFDPLQVTNNVQAAWQALADQVWQGDLAGLEHPSIEQTQSVWQRQVEHFWEISWCLTPDPTATNLLDRRKNWRTYNPPAEPGVSCMMMEGWQELSAEPRPGKAVNTFWKALAEKAGKSINTDLRPGETLCAIAYIKRRFAHYFHTLELPFSGQSGIDQWTLKGWRLPVNVPSVNYLAAAPWLEKAILAAAKDTQLREEISLLNLDLATLDSGHEGGTLNLNRIDKACHTFNIPDWKWQTVNGRYFYEEELALLAKRSDDAQEREILNSIQQRLHTVQRQLGKPSDFYSILLMDGDALGSQMSNATKQTGISRALNAFTRKVPDVVQAHSGFLVYAGGDDVLALLSVDDAIACADALRQLYTHCFAKVNQTLGQNAITTSLSAAVLFCHYKSPFAQNLAKAHPLLDKVAKEKTGRNSLAIEVWKPGGLHCRWSSPWERGDAPAPAALIRSLTTELMHYRSTDKQFSRKFLYKLEALIEQLGLNKPVAQAEDLSIDNLYLRALIRAAWQHSGKAVGELNATLLDELLHMTESWKREDNGVTVKEPRLTNDALKLLHFLTTEQISASPSSAMSEASV
ncbi:type III-B CRISPR-associated protein Cas10/Cmr2 [Marinobacterium aestuarii]|uniref:Type III-B CRISPR-associated protein Cas10/Cmr2 n=2 Tax=Marinobacterium aestuarii TaxID=1821621 RepID=A0A1A9EWU2_9GAMM|nr:type III-B CRISPR-associated protein Cas10/Cmr2 [Marinobacterium aestuarii]